MATREPNVWTTGRIEAFSDGVFAIAITLLVLEIKVPELQNGISLGRELLNLWTSYFGYVFSFLMIGIYWANHHYIFQLYKKTDHGFILVNLFFLMCISFLPFPTAVLARYIDDSQWQQTAIVFYAFGLFLPAFSWMLAWLYGSRRKRGLLDEKLDESFIGYSTRIFVVSFAVSLSAVLLALWNGIAGLILCVGLSLLYLLPPKKPVYREADTTDDESKLK
ncbi:MAG: TMEM175 family protein [Pyrinomonadaceae bacterium]